MPADRDPTKNPRPNDAILFNGRFVVLVFERRGDTVFYRDVDHAVACMSLKEWRKNHRGDVVEVIHRAD